MAMAISDSAALQTGLQFYPESILTPDGDRILANILGAGGGPRYSNRTRFESPVQQATCPPTG